MSIAAMKFGDLLGAIATKTPAPGGGAVACATGALGAALAGMVVAYSLGKKSLAAHQPPLERAASALGTARAVFLELADEDASAYAAVNELQRLPEGDPRRVADLPGAAERSVQIPMAALAGATTLLRLLEDLAPITNRNLRSDLAIAAVLAEAAARAAEWNVRVNAPLLPDQARRDGVAREASSMVADAAGRSGRVQKACA